MDDYTVAEKETHLYIITIIWPTSTIISMIPESGSIFNVHVNISLFIIIDQCRSTNVHQTRRMYSPGRISVLKVSDCGTVTIT
jgi:hypothetical protein